MISKFTDLKSILEKDKLDKTNFPEWFRNLRITLKSKGKLYVLETPIPSPPPSTASRIKQDTYQKCIDDSDEVAWIILAGMKPKFRKQIGFMDAYDMIKALQELCRKQARIQRYEVTNLLIRSKMAQGSSVDTHVFKMRNYIYFLERRGLHIPREFAVNLILGSLPPSYNLFIKEYHEYRLEATITELYKMLKEVERDMETKVVIEALRIQRERELQRYVTWENWIKSTGKVLPELEESDEVITCSILDHWRGGCKICQEEESMATILGTHLPNLSTRILDIHSNAHVLNV